MKEAKSAKQEIIELLKYLSEKHPELRLTQLIVNVIAPNSPCPEVFYLEDKQLHKKLIAFNEKYSGST